MTKEIRDNFDGLTYDEDESVGFTFILRNDPRGFIKVEGDLATSTFLKMYESMVKKPKYQRWVKPTDEEKAKGTKGHWEKLA